MLQDVQAGRAEIARLRDEAERVRRAARAEVEGMILGTVKHPNAETLEAMQELESGGGQVFQTTASCLPIGRADRCRSSSASPRVFGAM
jgi:hypothetical protein